MMNNKAILLHLFLWLSALPVMSQSVSGKVFYDRNANGVLDEREEGIEDVLISNGTMVVKTDLRGAYTINSADMPVFLIMPSGYEATLGRWWHKIKNLSNTERLNFGLQSTEEHENLRVLAVGDVQVGDKKELGYAVRTIINELSNRRNYDFSIFLGDIVNDNTALFCPIKQMIQDLHYPAWMVYGNHDRPAEPNDGHRGKSAYLKAFGPVNYAFIKNDILFITLNSLMPKGTYGYKNEYSNEALTFLRNITNAAGGDRRIVISQHIPLKWIQNKAKIFKILSEYNEVLVLSAHTHTVFQDFYELSGGGLIHELNAGATSGNWWTGQLNWQDNPLALMADGTPRGYFKLLFRDDSYQIRYKAVGLDENKQMSVWIGKNSEHITQSVDAKNRNFLVNVYAGSALSKVMAKTDESPWKSLERKQVQDPFVRRIKRLQDDQQYPNKLSKSAPYLHKASPHIWRGSISDDLSSGLHKLMIRVRDPYQSPITETAWFWVE